MTDLRQIRHPILLWCVFLLGFIAPADTSRQGGSNLTYTHPGTVMDITSRTPLEARVNAYGTDKLLPGNDACPRYEGPLTQTTSDRRTGFFELTLDADRPRTFLIEYCANGYVPRPAPNNPNTAPGTSVIPNPVYLALSEASLRAMKMDPRTEIQKGIKTLLDDSTADLKYLRELNGDELIQALAGLANDDRLLAMELLNRGGRTAGNVATFRVSQPEPFRQIALQGDPQPAKQILASTVNRLLNDLTSNLRYLRGARASIPSFSSSLPEDRRVVDMLLSRSR